MTFTHQELLQAVREAGRGRESFTCADVRKQLRVSTKDRKRLSQFHHSFRSFQKLAIDDIEKLGSNCYKLREQSSITPSEREPLIELELLTELELPIELELQGEALLPLAPHEFQPQTLPVLEPLMPLALQPMAALTNTEVQTTVVANLSTTSEDSSDTSSSSYELDAQPSARGWRDRAQWLGRRMAQLFGGAGVDAGTAA